MENSNFISQPERATPLLTDQLAGLADAARSIEGALYKERAYSKELRDYISRQGLHIQQMGEGQKNLRHQLSELQTLEATANAQIQRLTSELSQAMKELGQYRNAWSQVLRREEEARTTLINEDERKNKIEALEARISELHERIILERDQAERARKSQTEAESQIEILNAKLAQSEAVNDRLLKRISELEEMKRNYQLEVSAAEARLREQYEIEAIQLRQKMMSESSLELARQRERLKDSVEEALGREYSKKLKAEREKIEQDYQLRLESQTSRIRSDQEALTRNEIAMKDLRIAETEQALARSQADLIHSHTATAGAQSATQAQNQELQRLHEELRKSSLRQLEAGSDAEKLRKQLDFTRLNETRLRTRLEVLERQMAQLAAEHGMQQKILLQAIPEGDFTIVETSEAATSATQSMDTKPYSHEAITPNAPGSVLSS